MICSSYTNGYNCAVKSIDENWYRATIVNVTDTDVTVKYLDYGNSEIIERKYVKDLADNFRKIPTYAVRVYLPLVSEFGDNETVVNKMTALTKDYILLMTILEQYKNQWIIDIGLNDVSIIDAMKMENLGSELDLAKLRAQIDSDITNVKPMVVQVVEQQTTIDTSNSTSTSDKNVDEGKSLLCAFITHVESPEKFYLQLQSEQASLNLLQENIQIVAESLPLLEDFIVGKHCIVKYSFDNCWYRAVILDTDTKITTIRYIDYGNYDTITDSTSIRIMNDVFFDVPEYAICCSLPIVCRQSNTNDWPSEACQLLRDIMSDVVKFRYINKTTLQNFIELYAMERDITKEILTAGYGIELMPIDDYQKCYLSHINSLNDFYIQLSKDTIALEKMSKYLEDESNMLPLEHVSNIENTMCIALFEDNLYYRAKILQHTEDDNNLTEVLFVDYGNTSFVTNDCMRNYVEPKIAELPSLSKNCELRLPETVTEWSRQAEEKFAELTDDGRVVLTVKVISLGRKSIIDLFIDGNSISDILKDHCVKPDANQQRKEVINVDTCNDSNVAEIKPDGDNLGYVLFIKSPKDFYFQLNADLDNLSYITDTFEKEADNYSVLTEPNIGDICVAKYDQDNLYYRAKIVEQLTDTELRVHFIDYGNYSTTSDYRVAPDSILAIKPLAYHCTIEKSNETLTDTQLKQLNKLITVDDNYTIDIIDDQQQPNIVCLYLNDQNLYELIQQNDADDTTTNVTEQIDQNDAINISKEIVTEMLHEIDQNNELVCEIVDDMLDKLGNSDEKSLENQSNDLVCDIVTDIMDSLTINDDNSNDHQLSTINEQSTMTSNDNNEIIRDDPLIDAFISYGISPSNFYIQHHDSTDAVENMIDRLLDAEQFPIVTEPKVDLLCVAKHTDELYYRAKILSIKEENACEIFFIDYGNKTISNDLRIIPDDLIDVQPLAIHCKINGINPSSDIANENFSNFILSNLSKLYRVKYYPQNDGDNKIMSIDLFDEDYRNIFDLLVNDHKDANVAASSAVDVCSNVDATNTPSNVTNLVTCNFRKSSDNIAKEFLTEIVNDIVKIVTKSNHASCENLNEVHQEIIDNVLSNSMVNEKLENAVTKLLNVEKLTADASSDCSQATTTDELSVNGHQQSTNEINAAKSNEE